jgi:hypothetical protein
MKSRPNIPFDRPSYSCSKDCPKQKKKGKCPSTCPNACSKYCFFYYKGKKCLNDCLTCTYCGRAVKQGGRGDSAIWYDHVFRTFKQEWPRQIVAPACRRCNRNKLEKGLMEWLRSVRYSEPDLWKKIVNNNRRKKDRIAEKVRKVNSEQ